MTDFINVTHGKLDIARINEMIMTDSSTGATTMFIGTTRDNFEGKTVTKLEYEAFVPMAEKEIKRLCELIRSKWKVHNIAISHRLGTVEAKEPSIIIAINSEHRLESLEAVPFAIEELKSKVPIWKKEIYKEDSVPVWKENKECQWNSDMIQINASKEEIDRRISSFIQRKREEIDTSNVQEFCNRHVSDKSEYSCARTDSIVITRKDSSSHLRKSQVVNPSGPQQQLSKVKTETIPSSAIPEALEERLGTLEGHLLGPNKPVPKDIYARLKALEDRVLYLEGISPEYFNNKNLINKQASKSDVKMENNQQRSLEISDSLSQINKRIHQLQSSLKVKQEPAD